MGSSFEYRTGAADISDSVSKSFGGGMAEYFEFFEVTSGSGGEGGSAFLTRGSQLM